MNFIGQGLWTFALASSWQTGDFASAIWKFLSAFALSRSQFDSDVVHGSSSCFEFPSLCPSEDFLPFILMEIFSRRGDPVLPGSLGSLVPAVKTVSSAHGLPAGYPAIRRQPSTGEGFSCKARNIPVGTNKRRRDG
jgi:hypothetical protein